MEKGRKNTLHNTRSTAETRAFNRAVSNLVGGGEVSAEEVYTEDLGETKPQGVKNGTSTTGKCEYCSATGKYHKPSCPNKV
jgi:hypothetical protein